MYLNHEVQHYLHTCKEHIFVPNIKSLMHNQYILYMHVLQRYMYSFVNLNNLAFGGTIIWVI